MQNLTDTIGTGDGGLSLPVARRPGSFGTTTVGSALIPPPKSAPPPSDGEGESRSLQGRRPKRDAPVPQEGLILMDQTLERAVLDPGAATILGRHAAAGGKLDPATCVPRQVLDVIRRNVNESLQLTVYFPIDAQQYVWRAYWVSGHQGFVREPLVGLHVEKVVSDRDSIHDVAARYNLTDRERETLCGISRGLSSKELAKMMGISPNTIKSFLRMIMVKMGVATRAGLVANLLQSTTFGDQRPGTGVPKKSVAKEVGISNPRRSPVAARLA